VELGRATGARIVVRGEVPVEPVSVTVQAVDIERGMARLLGRASFLLVYDETGPTGVARLSEIHVIVARRSCRDYGALAHRRAGAADDRAGHPARCAPARGARGARARATGRGAARPVTSIDRRPHR
jgi:hypothetical protein